jgi:hypothetical protein
VNPSLWDVEDDTTTMRVSDMTVAPVGTRDVEEFCNRYHYAVTGGNMTWNWGLWHGVTLLGVVSYNLPTRPTCEAVFGPEHFDKVWHMGRLAMAEVAPHNSESRLIGGSLRAIRHGHPGVWCVLTFAATGQGHIGYVYQATNALYAGMTTARFFYTDTLGQRRSPKQGRNLRKADAESRGWTVQHEGPKHRYLYILGNQAERRSRMALLRYPLLPYPKAEPVEVPA